MLDGEYTSWRMAMAETPKRRMINVQLMCIYNGVIFGNREARKGANDEKRMRGTWFIERLLREIDGG